MNYHWTIMFLVQCLVTIQLVFLLKAATINAIIVQTHNGPVEGIETPNYFDSNVTTYIFRGIRYGKAPVGNLRFRAPVPVDNWTAVYDATEPGSVCTSSGSITNSTVIGSEDCLFVNVYTTKVPKDESDNPKLPCIVWIHGGGFVSGSGDLGLHGADRFLLHGTIVVSLNYRLGIFGFISTKDDVIPGNYGLKDQILALQWVKNNIAKFGGDPKNVTIMGESAGSASVFYLVQSEAARGLFQKAIAESGSSLNPWTIAKNPRTLAFRIGLLNGIWTISSKTLVEGLRKVNYKQLQRSTALPSLLDLWDPLNGLPFAPVEEDASDEAVVTGNSYDRQNSGQFTRVPLLFGFNSQEARVASTLPWYGIILLEQYNADSSNLTPDDMNASDGGKKIVGKKIKSFYFKNSTIKAGTDLVNFLSDDEFVRGIVKSGELMAKFQDIYMYRFAFTGGVQHTSGTPEGVAHAEELQFLFFSNSTLQKTKAADLTVRRMMQMWTNFAKTGNPTPYLNEYVNVRWPVVNYANNTDEYYMNIDEVLTAGVNPDMPQMVFWDDLYDEYRYPPYTTY